MAEAAEVFLENLSLEQRDKAVFPLKSPERFDWHFVPKERKGVSLKELNKRQRDKVHALLDSAMSQRGYIKATTIISLEKVLHDLENQNPRRDPELYFLSIFGNPGPRGTWGWRFEGHHLSINFTIVNGQFISGTPVFMGANPAEVKEGPRNGSRALAEEEMLARQLVRLLDDEQLKIALVSENAPKDILTGNNRKATPLEPQGLAMLAMNREQSALLIKLVKEYLNRYRPEIAEDDWKKIQKAGIERIHFAWSGSIEPAQPHYYRVQGPTFLIEYDNVQNNANHIHTVWRDFESDFGEDVLKNHYREYHSE